jgi:hypothetical protein
MSLSCDEARIVFPIAWSLPPALTPVFLRAVDAALAGRRDRGEGAAYRAAAELLPKFFIPPRVPRPEWEHFNIRKLRLRRRA